MARHIVIVTGANSGVGFGICQRLLVQLCSSYPTDALPQGFVLNSNTPSSCAHRIEYNDGLTLIMACRSSQRGEAARTKLLGLLDAHISRLQGDGGRAHAFRMNLVVDIVPLDLAHISSVLTCGKLILTKYPYVSRLICNAGLASFRAFDWGLFIKQLLKEPMNSVTAPIYYSQHSGELSDDGLGWVWQCNLFGHYVLYRTLQPLLLSSPLLLGARVIWISSLEASPGFYDSQDWQLKDTAHSYQGVKYQMDLIAMHLDQLALSSSPKYDSETEKETRVIRHFVTEPGVCSTNIATVLIGVVSDWCKIVVFYLVRLFGSPHHTIDPFIAAIAAVHVCLTSLSFLTLSSSASPSHQPNGSSDDTRKPTFNPRPVKFSAQTTRWGHPTVGIMDVKDFETHAEEGRALLHKMEGLYQEFKKKQEAGE